MESIPPDPYPSPFPFMRMPTELQMEVIKLSLPPAVVPDVLRPRGTQLVSIYERSLLRLRLSCRTINNLVKAIRRYKGNAIPDHVSYRGARLAGTFNIDPANDTLRISGTTVPRLMSANCPQASTSPIRRLMLTLPEPPDEYTMVGDSVPLDTSFSNPDLPNLREFTVAFLRADDEWDMDDPCLDESRGSPTFRSTGIEWAINRQWLDTGWEDPFLWGRDSDLRDREEEGVFAASNITYKIGSVGYMSGYYESWDGDDALYIVGGQWLGFRHMKETGQVFASPLSWSEIEPVVSGPLGRRGQTVTYHNHHPQFVCCVWTIDAGEELPPDEPHHRWTDISGDLGGIHTRVTIRTIWQHVASTFRELKPSALPEVPETRQGGT